jgi:hypothetical protein
VLYLLSRILVALITVAIWDDVGPHSVVTVKVSEVPLTCGANQIWEIALPYLC